jgi:serine protease Do
MCLKRVNSESIFLELSMSVSSQENRSTNKTSPSFAFKALALAAALTAAGSLSVLAPQSAVQAQSAAAPAAASAPLVTGLPDFTVLSERVGPSVVNIRTTERANSRSGMNMPGNDEDMQEFFRRFFGQPMPGVPRQGPSPSPRDRGGNNNDDREVPRGVGSGFILTADGYVMTNHHVVDGADEIYVTLTDKRELKAKLIGSDQRTDVAVVKIEGGGLPAVKIADINRLKVGEWVVAIGSPFGLENTITAGIVSAKQRDTGDYLPFIQTDVAVNPGNSGGPLINMRGEVVGINSQILSRTGTFAGVSFAIPIDEAIRVSDQLRSSGKVTRGRIGVEISEVSKEVAEALGLPKAQGALVRRVEKDSPSDKAGVEAGDVILKFEGKVIEKQSDLPRAVGNTKPGTRSMLEVWRKGKTREIAVVPSEMESDKVASASSSPRSQDRNAPKQDAKDAPLGLIVKDLNAAQRSEQRQRGGVAVEAAEGAASRAGIRAGDIIMVVQDTDITDAKQFDAMMKGIDKAKPVRMLIKRGEAANWFVVRPISK